MSKHTENCPDGHGLVCHFQNHRPNPAKPFVYKSPVFPDFWRMSVKLPGRGIQVLSYHGRDRAMEVATRVAAGDYTELDAA